MSVDAFPSSPDLNTIFVFICTSMNDELIDEQTNEYDQMSVTQFNSMAKQMSRKSTTNIMVT
eukprot:CAMPEP_0171009230 /NCGR_PEP_ID=MMETSP0736-20130129/21156_1 /TAXON_ID=186038 /ORGANISM="Fragilariopsis kerguelensis, Strain L26-C5" /LENGTH=61 /DNA_ID=CAMNT_0011440721 /DNA_START=917 /DNA_END=1102 /DNA_ORIENTATION=+